MERKLVKQGRDALTLTLPAQWIKQKGLKAGNDVYVTFGDDSVIVRADMVSSIREITIDAREMNYKVLWHIFLAKYVEGFDRIIILHDNLPSIKMFSQYAMGMIMEEHTNTRAVLHNLISVPEKNIDVIIRRVVHMFQQHAESLAECAEGKISADEVKDREHLLDVNVYYAMRYINKYRPKEASHRHFLLCATIESAADLISIIAKEINHNVKLAEMIKKLLESYDKYIFTENMPHLYKELKTFKKTLGKKTYVEGLAFELGEMLHNNLGFLMDK